MARQERNIVGIVDAGGRGAKLARAYEDSPNVDGIVVIPGNDMISRMARKPTFIFSGTDLNPERIELVDRKGIADKFMELGVTLADVAQDNAIESGVADELRLRGIPTVGPSSAAGQIESSKPFARRLGERAGIRQPRFSVHTSIESADRYIEAHEESDLWIKAGGLAEGKGAMHAKDKEGAHRVVRELRERFPKAAQEFLIEDPLTGEEFTTFFASDGTHVAHVADAQDHKREGNNDTGENTGGMGCVTPPLVLTEGVRRDVMVDVKSAIMQLSLEGMPYIGIGYYGGMLDLSTLIPNNVEFNARWGDPEVEGIEVENDMYELGYAITEKRLHKQKITTDRLTRVVIAAASRGYPRNYDSVKGKEISGLDEIMKMPGVELYGAGIKIINDKYIASGGRLFYVVAQGVNVIEARQLGYAAISRAFIAAGDGGNDLIFRDDIGWRDVKRLREQGY